MGRAIRRDIDRTHNLAGAHIDNIDLVSRMRITSVNPIAVNGHVSQAMVRRKDEIVGIGRSLNTGQFFEAGGVKEAYVGAELVDQQEAVCAGWIVRARR